MRILHTSDWHLGKTLDGYSRLDEQELFIEELINTTRENNIDVVIVAGDIYDSGNPPARAESLFYYAVRELSEKGKRLVVITAGNHDSPERLTASSPISSDQGIIMAGSLSSSINTMKLSEFSVTAAGKCFFEIDRNGEKAVFVVLPYPSEKRLNEIFLGSEEGENQKSYSEKIRSLFEELEGNFREDTINIAVSHLYVRGGETTDSERSIELGGSYAVDMDSLPKKAQYIALGHLHRPQKMRTDNVEVFYSGSPIQYSLSEINYAKSVYIADIKPGEKAQVKAHMLRNYKPIEVWRCESIEKAIERCSEEGNRNVWVYLEIMTDRTIEQRELKEVKDLKQDIISIIPVLKNKDVFESDSYEISERKLDEMFKDFYRKINSVDPTEELLELFLKISEQEEQENEA